MIQCRYNIFLAKERFATSKRMRKAHGRWSKEKLLRDTERSQEAHDTFLHVHDHYLVIIRDETKGIE